MKENIGKLGTEARNPRTINLDKMSSLEAVEAIMIEEKRAVKACINAKEQLSKAVDLYVETLKKGNRIIQAGSGCSGDYVQTDVEELEATFSRPSDGDKKNDDVFALHTQKGFYVNVDRHDLVDEWYKQIKNRDTSEDSIDQPVKDLNYINFQENDLLIIISASGRSPALVSLAKEAKKRRGKVVSLVMNENTLISSYSDIVIEAIVGEPPLTGSGRTLAGTASKILITTLSTAAHAQLGSVYQNLMVGLNVKKWLDNSKFVNRATRIVQEITGLEFDKSREVLEESDWNIKVACVMIKKQTDPKTALRILKNNNGFLRKVID